jgi:polar amino acid transport system permease protein
VFQQLLSGLGLTIGLTLVTGLLSMVIGVGVGLLRMSARPGLNRIAAGYIEIFRNVPALVLIVVLAFAVPNVVPAALRQQLFFNNPIIDWLFNWTGLALPYYLLAAAAGLTLNTSAYLAEIFRAGVRTIPKATLDAARTLGASELSILAQIIVPEGLSAALPAIATRQIHNMKNTALASFVAIPELFHATQSIINRTFQADQFLLLAALMYLALGLLMTGGFELLNRRVNA